MKKSFITPGPEKVIIWTCSDFKTNIILRYDVEPS